ncbi:hypothetical protein D3C75_1092940 [compost metagenome]
MAVPLPADSMAPSGVYIQLINSIIRAGSLALAPMAIMPLPPYTLKPVEYISSPLKGTSAKPLPSAVRSGVL